MPGKNEIVIDDPSKLWFTSDTHFGHRNILEYSHRPFPSVEQMNEELRQNWNDVVTSDGTIFHLGDFAIWPHKKTEELLGQLDGKIRYIFGNHDHDIRGRPALQKHFSSVHDMVQIKVRDADAYGGYQRITLSHFGFETWNKSHHGAWSLHGHSHSSLAPRGKRLDVGVDAVAALRAFGNPYTMIQVSEPPDFVPKYKSMYKVHPELKARLAWEFYAPISYADVKAFMATRDFAAVDHHDGDRD